MAEAKLRSELAAALTALAAANARIVGLEHQVAVLLEEKGRNSSNSGKPPSSDPPGTRAERRAKNKDQSRRKRGGQPGHRGSPRALVPPDKVDDVADHFLLEPKPAARRRTRSRVRRRGRVPSGYSRARVTARRWGGGAAARP